MSNIVLQTGEALAAEVLRRVALCTVAQGAETDLGAQVFEGRRKVEPDMMPCTSVIEADDTPSHSGGATRIENTQRFVIYAYLPCDPAHPNREARKAIRDLKRALFFTDGRRSTDWGRTVRGVKYLGKDIGPRPDGQAFVVAAVEFSVDFIEDLSAP